MPKEAKPQEDRRKKKGLRSHQIRILQLLSTDPNGWFNTKTILREARTWNEKKGKYEKVDPAWLPFALYGRINKDKIEASEKRWGFPSLLALEMVEMQRLDVEGKLEWIFRITQKGIEAYEPYKKKEEPEVIYNL